jgi:hypothetical protein
MMKKRLSPGKKNVKEEKGREEKKIVRWEGKKKKKGPGKN